MGRAVWRVTEKPKIAIFLWPACLARPPAGKQPRLKKSAPDRHLKSHEQCSHSCCARTCEPKPDTNRPEHVHEQITNRSQTLSSLMFTSGRRLSVVSRGHGDGLLGLRRHPPRSVREHCSPNSDEKCIEHATKCSARSPEQPNKAGPFTVQPNTRKNIEWGRPVPKAPEQP